MPNTPVDDEPLCLRNPDERNRFLNSNLDMPVQVIGLQCVQRKGRVTVMKTFVWAMVLVISLLGWTGLFAQSKPSGVMAEFTGASLKWIRAAEPEFQRRKLPLEKYMVSVVDQDDSVVVDLTSLDSAKRTRGSTGSYPGYEVEIRKKDLKVVRSNYIR